MDDGGGDGKGGALGVKGGMRSEGGVEGGEGEHTVSE